MSDRKQEKIKEVIKALRVVAEAQDEIAEALVFAFLQQEREMTEKQLSFLSEHVFTGLMTTALWVGVLDQKLTLHLDPDAEEPTFALTEKGEGAVQELLKASKRNELIKEEG